MNEWGETRHEARRYPRFRIEAPAVVRRDSEFEIERALQVSEGGMLLHAGRLPVVGEVFDVSFFLISRDFVHAQAEVIYHHPCPSGTGHLIGLRFVQLPMRAQESIRALAPPRSN